MYGALLLVKCVIELLILTCSFAIILQLVYTGMVESSSDDENGEQKINNV